MCSSDLFEKDWVDYNVPQLYWEIGHTLADYTTLLHWWNANNYEKHLYIGQALGRSIEKDEFEIKIRQTREMANVHGNCYWFGYQILDNHKGITDILKNDTHQSKALVPAYTHMHEGRPDRVKKLSSVFTEDMHFLTWEHNRDKLDPETAQKFVIYRFRYGEKVDISRAENIVTVTPDNFLILPYECGENKYTYAVTSLDAFGNESKERKIKISL